MPISRSAAARWTGGAMGTALRGTAAMPGRGNDAAGRQHRGAQRQCRVTKGKGAGLLSPYIPMKEMQDEN